MCAYVNAGYAQSIAALVMEGRAVGGSNSFVLFLHSSGTWCAAPPGFRNLLLDPIGLGETRVDAVRELLHHPEFVQRSLRGEWPPSIGHSTFVEVRAPDCTECVDRRQDPENSQHRAEQRRQSFRIV
jgi:hypothetical protein